MVWGDPGLLLWPHRWTGCGWGRRVNSEATAGGLWGVYFWHALNPQTSHPWILHTKFSTPTQKGLVCECWEMPNASLFDCPPPLPQSLGMSIAPPGAGHRKKGAVSGREDQAGARVQMETSAPPSPSPVSIIPSASSLTLPFSHSPILTPCPFVPVPSFFHCPLVQDLTSPFFLLLFLSIPPLVGFQSGMESLETQPDLFL